MTESKDLFPIETSVSQDLLTLQEENTNLHRALEKACLEEQSARKEVYKLQRELAGTKSALDRQTMIFMVAASLLATAQRPILGPRSAVVDAEAREQNYFAHECLDKAARAVDAIMEAQRKLDETPGRLPRHANG